MHFAYDAFVSLNQNDPVDTQFVRNLIEELEGRRGLRLYVPGRDDLSGATRPIDTADEIATQWVHNAKNEISYVFLAMVHTLICVSIT
ncbi:hypothetical protein DPMN_056234 [Dreissena polymorpha]|uniref:Uncharacterized protein n=1 Tax=Dreissena polymorpha TaxID=45954 RepID=A0A9D4CT94_DREPO|nr:hypothetical protein DPMN_056234 [Dreissena polymorpha]